jgi:hypothetical protein
MPEFLSYIREETGSGNKKKYQLAGPLVLKEGGGELPQH